MAESRLQRWSRKKTGAVKEAELPHPSTVEPELSPEEQELVINEALSEHEVLAKYNLPDPDAIELGTDIKGFLRKEIPELMRRRALRSLWRSNPVLAVLDGLNDYDEDFTDAADAGKIVKTLYKVGQGFDRTPSVAEDTDEPVGNQVQERAEISETIVPAGPVEGLNERSEPEFVVDSSAIAESLPIARHVEPAVTETEAEPTPRYRPRMRFDY